MTKPCYSNQQNTRVDVDLLPRPKVNIIRRFPAPTIGHFFKTPRETSIWMSTYALWINHLEAVKQVYAQA